MWSYLAFFVVAVIVIVAIVTSLIFARHSPPIADFTREIDISNAEGRAEMMDIARDALTFPGTNIVSASDTTAIIQPPHASQQLALCVIRGAENTNIRLAFSAASATPIIAAFARDKTHARIFSTEGKVIANSAKFARVPAQTREVLPDVIATSIAGADTCDIRADLDTFALSRDEFRAMIIAPSSPSSIVAVPVILSRIESRAIFSVDHAFGKSIGYLVIDSRDLAPYLINPRDGRIITAIVDNGDIAVSIAWPSNLAVPQSFRWSISAASRNTDSDSKS